MNNYIWSSLRIGVKTAGVMLISLLISNVISADDFGNYLSVLLFAATMTTLIPIRFGASASYYILQAGSDSESNRIYNNARFINLVSTSCVVLFICCLRGYLQDIFKLSQLSLTGYLLAAALIAAVIYNQFYDKLLNAKKLFKENAIYLGSSFLFQIVIIGIILYMKMEWYYLLFPAVIAAFLFNFFAGGKLSACFPAKTDNLDKKSVLKLLTFNSLSYVGSVAVFMDEKIDQYFVNLFLTKKELAYYSYPVSLAMMFFALGYSFSNVVYPDFCRKLKNNNVSSCGTLYKRNVDVCYSIVSFIVLVAVFNSEYIIPVILPDEYLNMLPALIVVFPGTVLYAVYGSVSCYLTAGGKIRISVLTNFVFLLLNALLNIYLIPKYGIKGAAVSTTFSFIGRAVSGFYLNDFLIGTSYNTKKLLLNYIMFVSLVYVGLKANIYFREIIVFLYGGYIYTIFLGKKEREYIKKIL